MSKNNNKANKKNKKENNKPIKKENNKPNKKGGKGKKHPSTENNKQTAKPISDQNKDKQQIKKNGIKNGDLCVYFSESIDGEPDNYKTPHHYGFVTDTEKTQVTHSVPNNKKPTAEERKKHRSSDGVQISNIGLPNLSASAKQAPQPDREYQVFRYQGEKHDVITQSAIELVKKWDSFEISYNRKTYQGREAANNENVEQQLSNALNLHEKSRQTLIRFAARQLLHGIPVQPRNGMDCISLVILAYQIAKMVSMHEIKDVDSVAKSLGFTPTHVSDIHFDQNSLIRLDKGKLELFNQYSTSRYDSNHPQRNQKHWIPSVFFNRDKNKSKSISDPIPLDHKTTTAKALYRYLEKSPQWTMVGLFKPSDHKALKHDTKQEKKRQSNMLEEKIAMQTTTM
jgi:hypothetical protein